MNPAPPSHSLVGESSAKPRTRRRGSKSRPRENEPPWTSGQAAGDSRRLPSAAPSGPAADLRADARLPAAPGRFGNRPAEQHAGDLPLVRAGSQCVSGTQHPHPTPAAGFTWVQRSREAPAAAEREKAPQRQQRGLGRGEAPEAIAKADGAAGKRSPADVQPHRLKPVRQEEMLAVLILEDRRELPQSFEIERVTARS